MIAWRRIRAALVLGMVSAAAWAVLTPILGVVVIYLLRGWHLRGLGASMLYAARLGAIVGFMAGLLYALLIADLLRRRGDNRVPLVQAMMAGLGGGSGLFLLISAAMSLFTTDISWEPRAILMGAGLYGVLGGLAGTAIAAVARRGQLPAPPETRHVGDGA